MFTCSANNASIHIYTYKAGLLAAVGHDVLLRVADFSLQADPAELSISGTIDPLSIEVVNATNDDVENPGALSESDRETILKYVQKNILNVSRYPEISFESTDVYDEDGEWEVEGDLTLHGTTRSITLTAQVEDDALVGEISLNQPAYGIKPFSAMMGTLKIKPDVRIVIRVPVAAFA